MAKLLDKFLPMPRELDFFLKFNGKIAITVVREADFDYRSLKNDVEN